MTDGRSLLGAVQRRGWRTYASARRQLSRAAEPRKVAGLARSRGSSLDSWNRVTSDRHQQFRHDHPPADGSVAIVCVSQRPHELPCVIANVERQREISPAFVLVPTGPGWERQATERAVNAVQGARVIWDHGDASLGAGLNAGMGACDARFVAKFDDDDHYGPHYLADALRAHRFAGAGVIGKHSYYAEIDGVADKLLRFAGHDFSYSSTLAGGTLVIDRDRVGDLRFDDVSLGEDRGFIDACHRRGVSTYSADRFNFLQHRGLHNTWQPTTEHFLVGCTRVDAHAAEHEVDR